MVSTQHSAFVQHMAPLRIAITDPGGLALELYSEGLIDMLARQKINTPSLPQLERSQELVEKLEVKIAENEIRFYLSWTVTQLWKISVET